MIRRMKNIRLRPMIIHLIVTLAYPAVKAFRAEGGGLMVFSDALTIIGLIMLVVGIIYSMVLHGDFDISRYYLRRGMRTFRLFAPRFSESETKDRNPAEALQDMKDKRANAFNYPLFLGIAYLLVSALIVFVILD